MKLLGTLGWAVFLGASWTWCIGMFLPVLLLRDHGPWAWAAFTIPNVVGAAAMAWILPDAQASQNLVQNHRPICKVFSAVTLAFHAFFAGWIVNFLFAMRPHPPLFLLALLIIPLVSYFAQRLASLLTVAASVAAAAVLLNAGQIPRLPSPVPFNVDLLWIALVCTFGLALCPYLDLTFHKARQATTPAQGRVAFALGFGVVFFAMILFTLAYSGWLARPATVLPPLLAFALAIHFLSQVILKFCLHGRAVARWTLFTLPICLAALLAGKFSFETTASYHGLGLFELIYRLFMSFYGLIFPAYVWICIFGKNRPALCLIAILTAAPMYWMGFIERQLIWLLPGVLIVFLARFLRPTMQLRPTT